MMDLTCEVCDSRFIDMDLCAGFRVVVCVSCKDTNSLYSLITKTQAKAEYLLTDEELADSSLVPSISRKNPHNPRWSDMRLYLRKQVRDFAICKFGSEEALQDALSSRTETRTDRKSQKFLKRLKELRSKTRVEKRVTLTPNPSKNHTHTFSNGKCTSCSLTIELEEL